MMGWVGKWLDIHMTKPWDSAVCSLPLVLKTCGRKLWASAELWSACLERKHFVDCFMTIFFLIVKNIYVLKPFFGNIIQKLCHIYLVISY